MELNIEVAYVYENDKTNSVCVAIFYEDRSYDESVYIFGDVGYGIDQAADPLKVADRILTKRGYERKTVRSVIEYLNSQEQESVIIVFPDGRVVIRGMINDVIEESEGAIQAAHDLLVSEGFSRVRELDLEKPPRPTKKLPPLKKNN